MEIGLLIDVAAGFGVGAIAQADLGVREHRNRPLDQLAPQAMEVLLTGLRRAGIDHEELATTLARFDEQYDPVLVPIECRERPPMVEIPEYRARRGLERRG
jgi:glucosyl-3-phosphoglycerate synthase